MHAMSCLRAALFGLVLAGSVAAGVAQEPAKKIKVVVVPVLSTFTPRWEYVDEDLVRKAAAETVEVYLRDAFADAHYDLAGFDVVKANLNGLGVDFEKSKQRTADNFAKLGARHEAGFVVLLVIEGFSQRNARTGEMLNNLGGPQSETKAKVRTWLYDAPGSKMLIDGKTFEGAAKGPFFGTTKRDELSGPPDAVGKMLELENKRRGLWIGRAACVAVNEAISKRLGLRPPNVKG